MTRWTDAQLQVITERDKNILVSAAAGSGKTAVLIERISELIIKENVDVNKFLVVTFTKAAAAEMKERLIKRLRALYAAMPERRKHIKKQLDMIGNSQISTIHSFCNTVVKSHFYDIDIDPSFRIGESTELDIIKDEVIDEIFEMEYEKKNDVFYSLVESFCTNKNDLKLREIVRRLYDFSRSNPYPGKWLEESTNHYDIKKESFDDSRWYLLIKDISTSKLKGVKSLLEYGIDLMQDDEYPLEYISNFEEDIRNVEDLTAKLETGYIESHTFINNISHSRLKTIPKARKEYVSETAKETVKAIRDEYKKLIDKLKKSFFSKTVDDIIDESTHMLSKIEYLTYLVNSFDSYYYDKKLESNILDFNDLEQLTIKLLDKEDVAEEYRKKYSYIFVDEYQDSNRVQEKIINSFKRDNNVFMVGDIKQSIYRFRMADPSLFLEKYELYKDGDQGSKRIDLNKNFRSRHEVLDFINKVFVGLMSKEFGGIEYDDAARLHTGSSFEESKSQSVSLHILNKNSKENKDLLSEYADMEMEARYISKEIIKMLGTEIYDAKEGGFRTLRMKDIVILLRSPRKYTQLFNEVFLKEGLSIFTDDNSGFFDVVEIKVLINYLKLIDNDFDDIALLSAMLSEIGGFSIEELVEVRKKHQKISIRESLSKYSEEHDNDISIKINDFLERIYYFRKRSLIVELDELIWEIIYETNYYYYISSLPNGHIRQANLKQLIIKARKFESTSVNGLFNFLRFIDKILKVGSDQGEAKLISENDDVIRLMSIHKSKGLEFPVVILAGCGRNFNLQDIKENIIYHNNVGIASKFIDPVKRIKRVGIGENITKELIKQETLDEEMRILYVALTRAVNKLLLVGSVTDLDKRLLKWHRGDIVYNLEHSKSYLDWIVSVLGISDVIEDGRCAGVEGFDIHVRSYDEIHDSFKEVSHDCKILGSKEFELTTQFFKSLGFDYQYKETHKIPNKVTVSELKSAAKSKDFELSRIPKLNSLVKKDEFTPADKGTFVHTILQSLDFKELSKMDNLKEQIAGMIESDRLLMEEYESIDISLIRNFLESDLFKRVVKSEKIYKELPFVLKKSSREVFESKFDESIYIQGIIDLAFVENEKCIIIDYKSDRVDDIKKLRAYYKNQLDLYKDAVRQIMKLEVEEAYLYSLYLNDYIQV